MQEDTSNNSTDGNVDLICNVCSRNFSTESEGSVDGYFGSIQVRFCSDCFSSVSAVVDQLTDDKERHYVERTH